LLLLDVGQGGLLGRPWRMERYEANGGGVDVDADDMGR
jgi:hypothetical protein